LPVYVQFGRLLYAWHIPRLVPSAGVTVIVALALLLPAEFEQVSV
jgi:hypothetical protein